MSIAERKNPHDLMIFKEDFINGSHKNTALPEAAPLEKGNQFFLTPSTMPLASPTRPWISLGMMILVA